MTTQQTLSILAEDSVRDLYVDHTTYHAGDSGLDLFFPEDVAIEAGETKIVPLGIRCEMTEDVGYPNGHIQNASYFLYPRSSISKTPLSLANSVGIIDSAFRGNICAALRNTGPSTYIVERGQRLVQICSRYLSPFSFRLVDELSETSRGEGGFGSTGK
jgi:dUTP pyrophosphatase